jgi:hypothetical protein
MELQALLTSNILPSDIVCQEIYKHLWRNKNLLNEAQTEAIVEDHFHIKKIIRAYFNCEDYLHVEYDEDDEEFGYSIHYMTALTGDMLYVLNDFENFTYPGGLTSPSLEKRCPDLFTEKYIKMYGSGDLLEFTFFLWKQMTGSMKSEFYQSTREYFMPHLRTAEILLPTVEIPVYTQSEIEGGI